MVELIEYSDDQIKLKVPRHLRKKSQNYFFVGTSGAGKGYVKETFAIELDLDYESVRALRCELADKEIIQWVHSERTIIRAGKSPWRDDAIETIVATETPEREFFEWELLIRIGKEYLAVSILGAGEFADSEKVWGAVIESIQLK